MVGLKVGRLTVIDKTEVRKHGAVVWRCNCSCGNMVLVTTQNLKKSKVKSCGCLARERFCGDRKRCEYGIWAQMLQRCTNPKHISYKNYGARGITVCKRWSSFRNFLKDLGERPTCKYTLERLDNTLGYGPDNCTWASRPEQSRNTSRNVKVWMGSEQYVLKDFAKRFGFCYSSVASWMRRNHGTGMELLRHFQNREVCDGGA